MQRSFMHRVRSFVASSPRAVGDALAWCFSPVPGSVKNWLTVLFLGVVLLDIGLAYIYVVPSLQNRLINQAIYFQQNFPTTMQNVAGGVTNSIRAISLSPSGR